MTSSSFFRDSEAVGTPWSGLQSRDRGIASDSFMASSFVTNRSLTSAEADATAIDKSCSSSDNAISIASTPAAEPSSEERASTSLAGQVTSRSSSTSSLFSVTSDNEDGEDYAPWDTAGEGQAGKVRKLAGSTSSSKTSILGAQWSEKEDAILVKAVDRLGTRWREVSKEFNRLSKTTRSNRAVEARWRLIVLGDKGKAPIMPRPTSSSLNAQPVVRARPSIPFTAKRRRRQTRNRSSWAKSEVAVLRESLNRHRDVTNDKQAIYRDFYSALPRSARTRSAIRNVCSKLLKGWDLPEEDEEEDEGSDAEEGSVQGNEVERYNSIAASKLTAAASHAVEDAEVSVTYRPSGLIIEDLPPHYHVKV